MSNLYTLSLDSIKYILGLIRDTVDLPANILDDLHIQSTTTYSSYRLDTLLKALKEENIQYCDEAISKLNKLSKEIITDKLQITNENTIYLLLTDPVNNVYEQWLLINGTPQMIGTTEMKLDSVYTKDEADDRYALLTDFNTLTTEVTNIKSDLNTHKDDIDVHITSDERTKWNNTADKVNGEDLVKKADIKTTIDETSTNEDICSGKAIYDAIKANVIGKETVLYEGNISATGTYTLTDDVNNYDFIVINHTHHSTTYRQSNVLTKSEISKCINENNKFLCVYGDGSASIYATGYFNEDKIIVVGSDGEVITSITGYKFGQVTVQNTITNPSPEQSYSLDEQLTGGTWIDGKPIYRKVLEFDSIPSGAKQIDISGLNFDKIIKIYGIGNYSSVNGYQISFPFNDNTTYYQAYVINNKTLTFSSNADYYNVKMVIEYTKTTD